MFEDFEMKPIKWPSIPRLPWNPDPDERDRTILTLERFWGRRVIVTEKIDGGNFCMTRHYAHARSLEELTHPAYSNVKRVWGEVQHRIPYGMMIYGEDFFIKRSIHYQNAGALYAPDFFAVFAIVTAGYVWNWDETVEFVRKIGLKTVPVLYDGIYDEDCVRDCYTGQSRLGGDQEGYVIRVSSAFVFSKEAFKEYIAKYVRPQHVSSETHWTKSPFIRNL